MPDSFTRDNTDDGDLERLLGALLDHDEPMPDSLSDAASALFGLRAVDQELAALVEDSDERVGSGVRGIDEHERVVVFATDQHTIELVLHDDAVVGQIVPQVPGPVRISDVAGSEIDVPLVMGRFRLEGRPTGPIRVAFTSDAARATTPWIVMGSGHPTP